MIRGFFVGLLVIISAVAALAQEKTAQTARPASSTARPASARDGHRRATGSTISIGNLESGTHTCGD
jgi:hypothetical protein